MAGYLGDMAVKWDVNKKDFNVEYPNDEEDGQLVVDNVLATSFLEELQARGFDLTTLKFTVRLHPSKGGRPVSATKTTASPPAHMPRSPHNADVPRITRDGIIVPPKQITGQVHGRMPGAKA